MNNVRCMIVDDEPLALDIIETYLNRLTGFEIIKKCTKAIEAFKFLETNDIDLLFLDIQMPQLNGIDLLKSISNLPAVIITTAYRDYAVQSYELAVVDYLLKPISFDRFLKSIDKFQSQKKNQNKQEDDYIYVKENKKIIKIFLKDVFYIESIKDYVRIYCKEKTVVTKQLISYFEEKLPNNKFVRIHRSFVVSIKYIEAFGAANVEINGNEIPIGRSYRSSVFKALKYDTKLF